MAITGHDSAVFVGLGLAYSIFSIVANWEVMSHCSEPIHVWLLTAYACIVAFRLIFYIGHSSKGKDHTGPAWYLWRSTPLRQRCFTLTWAVLMPFQAMWTLLGMSWFSSVLEFSPHCFPSTGHPSASFITFILTLLTIGTPLYAVFAYNAWELGRSLERGKANLDVITQDDDLESRWGPQRPLLATELCHGVPVAEIAKLPCEIAGNWTGSDCSDCSICLCAIDEGETVRRLTKCRHVFHRSCLDLWLLRDSKCPMCKVSVTTNSAKEE